ncbi:hypothetical protein Peur_049689 [Populus x canadensis]
MLRFFSRDLSGGTHLAMPFLSSWTLPIVKWRGLSSEALKTDAVSSLEKCMPSTPSIFKLKSRNQLCP